MALLEDQIEEARQAFRNAHEAGDKEAATALSQRVFNLEAQKAELDKVATESSQAGTDLKNPLIAAGVGAVAGATVNPIRGAVHNIITPPAAPPKMSAPPPSSLSGQLGQGGENWTKSLTGVDIPNAQMNKGSLDTAQRMAATVGRGGELAGGRITESGVMLPPEVGAKPVAPAPRTVTSQAKQVGKSLLQGVASEPQPISPFSMVKGGTRGAITGAALGDIPQQIAQGNYGTAASDLGVAVGNIAQGLSRTPKGKAIGTLLGLGSGALRGYQGVNELTGQPEGRAQGGLVHLADGGQPQFGEARAYEPSYSEKIRDYAAKHIGRETANRLFAGPNARPEDIYNPVSLAAQTPGAIADSAAGFLKAGQEGNYLEGMGHYLVGALNVAPFTKPLGKLVKKAMPKMAGGGEVLKAGANLAKKTFAPKQTQVLRASEALGPHEGKFLNITQSDRMRSTGGDLGGPGFSKFQLEKPEYAAAQAAWGVGNQPTASRIVNVNKKFPEGQAIWTPMIGSETQHHSNQHVFDALTQEFNRQVAAGKLTPELRQRINQKLAMAVNKEGKPIFQEGVDIANPEHLQSMGSTFERRGNVANLLAGNTVGGQKGRIIDYPGIMQEMTDPMTVGAPTHALGTRLFTLNNQIENRPDLHSAFPYILKGQDQGVAFAPVPKELGIQDWINQFREFKGREPGFMDLTRNAPSQQITEKYLRSLEAAGHAAGGSVDGYAPGGKVLSAIKKMSDEAQAAYKAKFTPGFYHGSPSNKIKEFDSNKGDKSWPTEGVTFATRQPKFADGFLDMHRNKAGGWDYDKGSTIYPININLGKHFVPGSPEGSALIDQYIAKMPANPDAAMSAAKRAAALKAGAWDVMEDPKFLQHLRETGHDTFTVMEGGVPNVGVFEPQNIRGKFAKFNPEDAADPDFMKAEGGPVQHFQAGGLSRLAKYAHSQNPKVAQALEEYLKGNISQEERIRIANQFLPIRQWNELPPNYSDEQIRNALMSNKQEKALAPVPAGMRVGNRLDIPAYTQNGVYVDTTHALTGSKSPISYNRTGHLKGVEFSSKPNQAVRVGLGTKEQALTPMGAEIGSGKSPFALIEGTNVGTPDDEVRRMMAEMMKDPRYTQIGMDPRKHSQFYDKSTGMPVFSAEEKLQSGPLIIAPKRGLETTSWDDPRLNLSDFEGKKYKKGGKVKKK